MSNPLPRAERLTDDRPALVACRHCNGYIVDNGGYRMTHTEPFRQVTIICDTCVQTAIDLSMAVTLAHAEADAAMDALRRKLADTPDEERCDRCDTLVPYGTLYYVTEEHWTCGDCYLATDAEIYDASSVDYGRYVL